MDLKNKKLFSYRGGMYLLLAILIVSLIGGVFIYRNSLINHIKENGSVFLDDVIFFTIIGIAIATPSGKTTEVKYTPVLALFL